MDPSGQTGGISPVHGVVLQSPTLMLPTIPFNWE